MVGRQAIGIDTFDRSTRVRHPDPVRFSECFDSVLRFGAGRGKERKRGCEEEHVEGIGTTRWPWRTFARDDAGEVSYGN